MIYILTNCVFHNFEIRITLFYCVFYDGVFMMVFIMMAFFGTHPMSIAQQSNSKGGTDFKVIIF